MCMCVYMCLYVYMHVSIYICMYVCVYKYKYIYIYICVYFCMYVRMYVHMYIPTRTYVPRWRNCSWFRIKGYKYISETHFSACCVCCKIRFQHFFMYDHNTCIQISIYPLLLRILVYAYDVWMLFMICILYFEIRSQIYVWP